jgi:hypothetical protein
MPTRVAICLYEENIDSLDPVNLLGAQALKKIILQVQDDNTALYLKPSSPGKPEWTEIVSGFADLRGEDT